MEFAEAFERLLGNEGELSMDPDDIGNYTPAGELKGTKYGISARAHPSVDIVNLTADQSQAIYFAEYWTPNKIDQLPDMLRFDVFDGVVNSGRPAIQWLQRALRVNDDGYVGAVTVAAARAQSPYLTLARYSGERLLFMTNCKAWATQGKGWARRVANNLVAM